MLQSSRAADSLLPTLRGREQTHETRHAQLLVWLEQNGKDQTKLLLLAAWFLLNLVLTMCNKAILAEANFPWLLTTLQLSLTAIGCFVLVILGALEPARLDWRESFIITAFSLLFTINIATSNVSLGLVSVPLHQVVRSSCPVVTLLIYRALGRSYSPATYASVLLLIIGVGLATLGDYYCTLTGFLVTFTGVVLAACKTIATNSIMTGSMKFPALNLLLLLTPLATIQCVFCAFCAGEVQRLHLAISQGRLGQRFGLLLLANGSIAFLLNIISLQTNKVAGAVTMTVAGNVKQIVTILLGIIIFQVRIDVLGAIGIAVTIIGAAWYSKLDLEGKKRKAMSSEH